MREHRNQSAEPVGSSYEPTAQMITALATMRRGGGAMWTWLGPIFHEPKEIPLQIAIAEHLGLRPRYGDFGHETLLPITPPEAKVLLGYLALDGIGLLTPPTPDATLAGLLDEGFAPFGAHAHCYSNGDYHLVASGERQGAHTANPRHDRHRRHLL